MYAVLCYDLGPVPRNFEKGDTHTHTHTHVHVYKHEVSARSCRHICRYEGMRGDQHNRQCRQMHPGQNSKCSTYRYQAIQEATKGAGGQNKFRKHPPFRDLVQHRPQSNTALQPSKHIKAPSAATEAAHCPGFLELRLHLCLGRISNKLHGAANVEDFKDWLSGCSDRAKTHGAARALRCCGE